tara:strand:+ start:8649 stop:9971 length:1323 start_codon:yes stop_codon:yes gene_type:complete
MFFNSNLNVKKNAVYSVFEVILTALAVFISYKFIISLHGVAVLGVWSAINAWLFFGRASNPGLGAALARYVARLNHNTEFINVRYLVDSAFWFNFIIFFLLSFASYFFISTFIDFIFSDENSMLIALQILPFMCAGLFFSGMSGVFNGALKGIHMGFISSYINIFAAGVHLIAILLLVPDYGLLGLAYARFLQLSIMTIFGWMVFGYITRSAAIQNKLPVYLPFLFRLTSIRKMLIYGINNQIVKLSVGSVQPISKILISKFFGLEFLGIYELASKLVEKVSNIITRVTLTALPAFSSIIMKGSNKWQEIYFNLRWKASFYSAFPFMVLSLCSPLIFFIFFNENEINWEFSKMVTILCVAYYFVAYGALPHILGNVFARQHHQIAGSIISIIILTILGVVAGLYGTSTMFLVIVAFALFSRSLYIKIRHEKDFLKNNISN